MAKRKTKTKAKTKAKAKAKTKAMTKGISYWSFAGGLENRADILSVLGGARRLGFTSIELGISDTGVLTLDTSRSECQALAKAAAAAGVEISALTTNLYWAASLSASKAAVRSRAVEMTRIMIEKARWLGAGSLIVIPGWVQAFLAPGSEVVPYDQALARSAESIRKCRKDAEKHRVTLALVNAWSKLLVSPLEMRDFVDKFRSRRVAACLDVGNAATVGCPQHWISILGRRIVRVHLKDFKSRFEKNTVRNRAFRGFLRGHHGWGQIGAFCDLGAGDVDWPAVMAALGKARYKGPLTAEVIPTSPGLLERIGDFEDKLLRMK